MTLTLDRLCCGYGAKRVVDDVSFELRGGEIMCLLGPNGVGKTTLFKTILGFLKSQGGRILLDGRDMRDMTRREIASRVAYVPQAHTPPFPFNVLDVVAMGRAAHLGMFASPTRQDNRTASEALASLGISYLSDRSYTEISGGERQMVLIARALTQQPGILIMDEPTSNLDFGNQIRVLSVVKRLSQNGMGLLMTSHFPDHAFLCNSRVALLRKGRGLELGSADEVVTEDNLRSAFHIDVRVIESEDSVYGTIKTCVPLLH